MKLSLLLITLFGFTHAQAATAMTCIGANKDGAVTLTISKGRGKLFNLKLKENAGGDVFKGKATLSDDDKHMNGFLISEDAQTFIFTLEFKASIESLTIPSTLSVKGAHGSTRMSLTCTESSSN